MIGRTRDQLVHLQNMQEIDNLMTFMGSNNSQAARTDASSLTNSNSIPVNPATRLSNIQPIPLSTNNHVTTTSLPPHDICRVLSSNHTRSAPSTDTNSQSGPVLPCIYEADDGHRYVRLNQHVRYSVSNAHTRRSKEDSLVDRGANGGFAGDDVRVLDHTFKTANVTGIEDHTVQGLPICNRVEQETDQYVLRKD